MNKNKNVRREIYIFTNVDVSKYGGATRWSSPSHTFIEIRLFMTVCGLPEIFTG